MAKEVDDNELLVELNRESINQDKIIGLITANIEGFNLPNSEFNAEVLCRYGKEQLPDDTKIETNPTKDPKDNSGKYSLNGYNFYSFDGSKVLSSQVPGVGSHSDLGVDDKATDCGEKNQNKELSKQGYIFNFTYNFTKKFKTQEDAEPDQKAPQPESIPTVTKGSPFKTIHVIHKSSAGVQ